MDKGLESGLFSCSTVVSDLLILMPHVLPSCRWRGEVCPNSVTQLQPWLHHAELQTSLTPSWYTNFYHCFSTVISLRTPTVSTQIPPDWHLVVFRMCSFKSKQIFSQCFYCSWTVELFNQPNLLFKLVDYPLLKVTISTRYPLLLVFSSIYSVLLPVSTIYSLLLTNFYNS